MLEDPGVSVGDEDGMEAGGEGGVDVGAGAVADHPGAGRIAGVAADDLAVGVWGLFGEDLDRGEERRETRATEFFALFEVVALGDEEESMTACELLEGGLDAGDEIDVGLEDGVDEAHDLAVLVLGGGCAGELFKAADEREAKAFGAVAALGHGAAFDAVEVFTDLGGGVLGMVKKGDERGDRSLEEDVVFPEGVVGVEEQGLRVGLVEEGVLRGRHAGIVLSPATKGDAGGERCAGTGGGGACASGARPAALVSYGETEAQQRGAERLWRGGQPSGQRELAGAVAELAREYQVVGRYALRPGGSTYRRF